MKLDLSNGVADLTPAALPYDFVASAARAHEAAGIDFSKCFDAFFVSGYVFKGPDYFLMGGDDIINGRTDAWLVWWAEVSPHGRQAQRPICWLSQFLYQMVEYRPFVGWARPMKGRKTVKYYSTDSLIRLTRTAAI